MTEIHKLTCWTCKKPINDAADYVEINLWHDGETQPITTLHPECYNTVVQYLEKQNAEWEAAHQVPAHRSSKISSQAT